MIARLFAAVCFAGMLGYSHLALTACVLCLSRTKGMLTRHNKLWTIIWKHVLSNTLNELHKSSCFVHTSGTGFALSPTVDIAAPHFEA